MLLNKRETELVFPDLCLKGFVLSLHVDSFVESTSSSSDLHYLPRLISQDGEQGPCSAVNEIYNLRVYFSDASDAGVDTELNPVITPFCRFGCCLKV